MKDVRVNLQTRCEIFFKSKYLLLVPLLLSAFTHLWNPVGFPAFEQDEGLYIYRSLFLLEGLGPQLPASTYVYSYDHPYFGQLFLAGAFSLINYPNSLNPSGNLHSIEMLYLVPRVLMGLLAIFDTFLVYKIAGTRYNRKVAIISATLFAVMPSTWFLRRIYLDSIQLPFLLLSILFALYYAKRSASNFEHNSNKDNNKKNIILVLLSGTFLGITIFTKIPVFTMIPLIVFIILKNGNGSRRTATKSKLKSLGIWFIPVILIPMIWPAYAISAGQFDQWVDGVLWQATRADRPFPDEINNVFSRMDPVLLGITAVGIIYSVMRREYFVLLWLFPYLILLYFLNWVYFFHLIIVLPVFSIVTAVLLTDLLSNFYKRRLGQTIEISIFATIIIFGLLSSAMLITQNHNNSYFKLVSSIIQMLPHENSYVNTNNATDRVTLIGPGGIYSFYWIPSLVFGNETEIKWFEENRDYVEGTISTKKFILVADGEMRSHIFSNSTKEHVKYVSQLYRNSTLYSIFELDWSNVDFKKYPYTNILDDVYKGIAKMRGLDWSSGPIEIRTNY